MNISKHISEIELCDWYIDDDHEAGSLYFSAPLNSLTTAIEEAMKLDYPDAEFVTISLEFPTDHPEASYVTASYSPTIYDPEEEAYTDCDWNDVDMPYEDIEKLFGIAEKMLSLWSERRGRA